MQSNVLYNICNSAAYMLIFGCVCVNYNMHEKAVLVNMWT